MRSNRKGFTLIELLVVIAIIAILAAILFPVFAKARDKARQTACSSNMKQLATAVMMYAQDYDETYPANWVLQSVSPSRNEQYGNPLWLLEPYVKSSKLFICPSDSVGNSFMDAVDAVDNTKKVGTSYTWNSFAGGVSSAKCQEPSRTFMINEGHYPMAWLCYYPAFLDGERHSGGSNAAFLDGHVKFIKPNTYPVDPTYDNTLEYRSAF